MTGYTPGGYYDHDCRSCGHTADQHDEDNLCTALVPDLVVSGDSIGCACPGWIDQPTITSPIDEARSIQAVITAEQWVMPMHAAQRLAMICDDLDNGRDVPYSIGPASLLQYLPPTAPKPPCGAIAPIHGHYYCDSPQGHRGKHHVSVGQYNPYDVLWKSP